MRGYCRPRGAHTEAISIKVCVLGVWQDTVVWPLLWVFVPGSENETVVGKKVFAAAETVLGKGFIRHLLIDRGYLDGAWISKLHEQGTQITVGVKEDTLIFEEMQNQMLLADKVWTEVKPPKIHGKTSPQRVVTGFTDLQGEWQGCTAPLSGCLVRDTLILIVSSTKVW